jgi:hypothetical protein
LNAEFHFLLPVTNDGFANGAITERPRRLMTVVPRDLQADRSKQATHASHESNRWFIAQPCLWDYSKNSMRTDNSKIDNAIAVRGQNLPSLLNGFGSREKGVMLHRKSGTIESHR